MAQISVGSDVPLQGNRAAVQVRNPAWLAAGFLLILAVIFMARALLIPPDQMLGGNDLESAFYPWFVFVRTAIYDGRLPLWDPYQFAGTPLLSNPQIGFFYPPVWLTLLLPVNVGISLHVTFHLWWAGLGMLLMVRFLNRSWLGALLSALTFMFGGFMVARLWAGHLTFIAVHAWVPWVLLAAAWSARIRTLSSAILAGLPFGMAALAGHPTSLIYLTIIWIAFVGYLGWAAGHWKWLVSQFGVSLLAGLMLASIQIVPVLEILPFSRPPVNQTADGLFYLWSMPFSHWVSLFVPHFFGDPVHTGYWGAMNFEELTYYAGTLIVPVMVLGLLRPTRLTWFYLALAVFGLLVALGSYGFLYPLLTDLVVPFRLARVPGRAAFLFTFAASALIGEAVSQWEASAATGSGKPFSRYQRTLIAVLALSIIAIVILILRALDRSSPEQLANQARSLAWAVAGIGSASLLLRQYFLTDPENLWRRLASAVGLVGVVIIDLWSFGYGLVELQPVPPAPVWSEVSRQAEPVQRAAVWTSQWTELTFEMNSAGLVGVRSISGYNPLESKALSDLLDVEPSRLNGVYDILGVDVIVADTPLDFGGASTLVGQIDSSVWIYRRDSTPGLARLVYQTERVTTDEAAVARIHAPDFDPAVAVVTADLPCAVGPAPDTPGVVRLLETRDGYWQIETHSDAPALLILSEAAYPGWRVLVDGQAAESLTAYTLVNAVCVPAGTHRVEWTYAPVGPWIGLGMTVLAAIIMIGAALRAARGGFLSITAVKELSTDE